MMFWAIPNRALAWLVPILAEAAALGRSVLFAWLIGPDQLGQAMMLALVVRLVEMTSDLGIDRLILQARDGNTARLQSELQGVAVLRGLLGAVVLLALAPVLAAMFADGPSALSYAVLSVIPALRGMVHLDYRRAERRFRYGPMAVIEGGATLTMAACVFPAAALLGDHRAMAVVLITQAVAFLVLSHWVANRQYRLRFSTSAFLRVWKFGAPLILNAVLLFFTFYADRLIVAQAYDWAVLAVYGVTLQLALLPAQIVGRAASSLVLPRLREAIRLNALSQTWPPVLTVHVALALALVIGFTLIAPGMISLVYGPDFRPEFFLALAVGLAAGFRVLRTPYSLLAVATGRTGDPARANLMRAAALIPAAGFAAAGLPLAAIGLAAALGEAAATLRAVFLARATLSPPSVNEVFA